MISIYDKILIKCRKDFLVQPQLPPSTSDLFYCTILRWQHDSEFSKCKLSFSIWQLAACMCAPYFFSFFFFIRKWSGNLWFKCTRDFVVLVLGINGSSNRNYLFYRWKRNYLKSIIKFFPSHNFVWKFTSFLFHF